MRGWGDKRGLVANPGRREKTTRGGRVRRHLFGGPSTFIGFLAAGGVLQARGRAQNDVHRGTAAACVARSDARPGVEY